MYVTPLRICFTSSFIDAPIAIPLEDVLAFERKSSFVCDTIVVLTKARDEYNFTAFISTGVTQMHSLLKTLWSVREKYAAGRANSTFPEHETGVLSSASTVSRGAMSKESSAVYSGSSEPQDGQPQSSQHPSSSDRLHTSDKQDPDMSESHDRCAASLLPLHMGSPSTVEKQTTHESSVVRSGSSEKRKRRHNESCNDVSSWTTPEFRRFFPLIPHTETLADSFTCCYQFGASRLGKMWITQHFILFVSPMLTSKIEIKFSEVARIEKEQKLVLLDGFCVRLKSGASMSFSNFTSRDAALNVIESAFHASKAREEETSDDTKVPGPLFFKTTTSENDEGKMPAVASMDAFSEVETEYGSAFSDFSCFGREVITPVKLCTGKGVLDVFGVCFDDGTALLEDYHTERKDTEQKWEAWRPTKDGGVFRGQRQFTCKTLVKAMFGRPYKMIEYQRYALFKVSGVPTLAVQFSSQVPGVTFENDEGKMPAVASMDAFSEVETEYGSAFSDFSCFGREVITPVKLCTGKGVLDVFGVCFDDGTALLEDYHTERKDTEQKWEAWRPTKDGGVFRGQRQFTCKTLVKAMFGRPYKMIEYQRYALFKVSGVPTLAVQFSSQVPGVTFGEAFRVEALVTFTQAGSGASAEVTMHAFGHVQFLKSVWAKSRILSTTMETELPEGYGAFAKMLAAKVAEQSGISPVVSAASIAEELAIKPGKSSRPPPHLKPQSALQRRVMAYGTTSLTALVLVVCMKSLLQTLFLSQVSSSDFCAAASVRERDHLDILCQTMVAEWNGVLSVARPALVTTYLFLITFFCGVMFKAVALS
ncbi:hypothetical protein JKF63_05452 [Porcisia hertigi]|uniref:VASt domain-containing protein n=1 Tax=Porcisia hertigi TaxID=2761500 RepID=A0A836HYS0_9TRYP|nr:hypothetical protein JKF63_05452 [Porcisia hertigi]